VCERERVGVGEKEGGDVDIFIDTDRLIDI